MHILIVDPEYLVALDAEQVLSDALAYTTEIVMPRDYLAALENRRFDVVLIDVRVVQDDVASAAARIAKAGASVVLSSLSHANAGGFAGWPGVPVVLKPFDDPTLIRTIKDVAAGGHDVSPPRT